MKIPESIIEKYQLIGSPAHIGLAILHDFKSFKSSLPGFESVVFLECDFEGKPCKDIKFYNKAANRDGTITPEFMNDMSVETILQIVS